MKKYSMGIFTGIAIGVSSMMFLGSSSINNGIDRYEYISGSTVDLKIFDKRTGKMYVRGRDFVTEYDVINVIIGYAHIAYMRNDQNTSYDKK